MACRKADSMDTTVTHMQRIPPTLVKWTYLFLILLAVTFNTFSGELSIARANPIRASVASETKVHSERQISNETLRSELTQRGFGPVNAAWYNLGCIRFKPGEDTCLRSGTSRTCLHYSTATGKCLSGAYSSDPTLIGCLSWDPSTGACIEVELANIPPCSGGNPDPDPATGLCKDGSDPTCGGSGAFYDPDFMVCTKDPRTITSSTQSNPPQCPPNKPLVQSNGLCGDGSTPTCTTGTYDQPSRTCITTSKDSPPQCPPNKPLVQSNGLCGDGSTPTCTTGTYDQTSRTCTTTSKGSPPQCPPNKPLVQSNGLCGDGSTPTCTTGTYDQTSGTCTTPNPSAGCPSGYTLVNQKCQYGSTIDATHAIDPTCSTGYVYTGSTGGCLPNPIARLIDTSSSKCVVTPTPTPANYTCTYTGGILKCTITTTATTDDCLMNNNLGTLLGHYQCKGLDNMYDPLNGCDYYGIVTATTPVLGNAATCDIKSTGTSATFHCLILSCFDAGTGKYEPCTSVIQPSQIPVSITQNCTQVTNPQPLTCTYGDQANNNKTIKAVQIAVSCSGAAPAISCTTTDPYGRQIKRVCHITVADPTSTYPCDITDNHGSSTDLWVEKCHAATSSPLPHCDIFNQAGNLQLGSVDCTGTSSSPTCTLKDLGQNSMTLNCNGAAVTYQCISTTPDCPHTGAVPSGSSPTTAAVTESTIACDGNLLVNLFLGDGSTKSVTLIYPLSQAELEFVLPKLGVGSQSWTTPPPNLPKVTYL